jgi:hypothetical protein
MTVGCKKIEVGYLSDNIRYGSNPIAVDQGTFYTAVGIIPDASTPPFTVTLLDVRNKATGKREESFFKEYNIMVWKSKYNPLTDTTLAIINGKRGMGMRLPLTVLEKSGQFMFTQATDSVPTGEYEVDIRVKNPKGTKDYKNITTIKLSHLNDYTYINTPYSIAAEANSETGIRFTYDDQWIDPNKGQSTSLTLKIKHVADEPNQIVLKVYDKNGALFPGKALDRRPSGNSFLKTLSTFAYKTTVTDTAVVYDYAQVRFPDVYWDTQSNGLNCYYRIQSKWIQSVDYADINNWNPPSDINYLTHNEPVKLNIRFNTTVNKPGKYIYELHLRATKNPNAK